jgi:hypothetical protein
VTKTIPAEQHATDVSVTSAIEVRFDDKVIDVNVGTVALEGIFEALRLPSDISWDRTTRILVVRPKAPLTPSTGYRFAVEGLHPFYNGSNINSTFIMHFTTGPNATPSTPLAFTPILLLCRVAGSNEPPRRMTLRTANFEAFKKQVSYSEAE